MIVAGIGCRKGATAADVDAAIEAALAQAGLDAAALSLIATSAHKSGEAGIKEAATARGLAVALIAEDRLEASAPRIATPSARVFALTGLASIAEAAALAAAGPKAMLLVPRIAVGPATCALAAIEQAP